ncbi:iron chaperone [Nonomuraea jabiensis]|uniref:iron chaperone n=1 Tax=Nonomuraea jabiensis TaxID=882448 RepID=UPI003D744CCB
MSETKKTTKSAAADSKFDGFTDDERAAMKEHAQELKKAARRASDANKAAEAERDVLEKIAEMADEDRVIAERIHAIVKASAPSLSAKLWYGQPAYAKDGKIVCFFQPSQKFKTRYSTLGFNDPANLDDGTMWPTAFALTELTAESEERISALVKQAAS